jgi:MID domain of pPIWI_RE
LWLSSCKNAALVSIDLTQAWERYLKDVLPDGPGYGLALIELHKLNEINPEKAKQTNYQQYHPSQNIKGAVRRACNKLGLASQMILPMKQNKEGKISQAHQYRARNSITDLLYRRTCPLFLTERRRSTSMVPHSSLYAHFTSLGRGQYRFSLPNASGKVYDC